MIRPILAIAALLASLISCSAEQQHAACVGGCAVAGLGTAYGCSKIDAEEYPEERKLCEDGRPVVNPACLALCVPPKPDDESE